MTSATIIAPDEAALRGDLQSAAFLVGVFEGRWAIADPPGLVFPELVVSVSAGERPKSPDRFWLKFELTGYRAIAPTSMLWDPSRAAQLDLSRYPKGGGDVAKVFRTDWPPAPQSGSALYHPLDRRPLSDHHDWPQKYAHQVWTPQRTIVDYLEMVYGLLNSPGYRGV